MSERIRLPKRFSFEDIHELLPKGERDNLQVIGKNDEWIAIRKEATDWSGSYIVRAFKKINGDYEELDLEEALEKGSSILMKKVNAQRLIKEVLVKLDVCSFIELMDRLQKEPKVSVGVQRGSCMYLYVRGKKGKPMAIQLTE